MEKYRKFTYIGISIALSILLVYVFFKYTFLIILPFTVSYFIAVISRPMIDFLCRHTRVSKSIVSVSVMFLMLFVLAYIIFAAASAAITQIGDLINTVSEHLSSEENYITYFFDLIDSLRLRFPFLENNIADGQSVYSIALDMISTGLKNLSLELTSGIASVIASLPNIIVTGIIVILSLFYFSKDYGTITGYLTGIIPVSLRDKVRVIKRDVISVVSKYCKSYFILLLITFIELFIGFLILKIDNAFVLALLIALVDVLPVLGVGTVLLPWAAILFIGGNTSLAVGMLILYTVVYLLRQIEEPRIMGKQMNVHPLFALFATYAGLRLAGISGMIIGPFLAFVIKTLYDSLKNKKDIENKQKL